MEMRKRVDRRRKKTIASTMDFFGFKLAGVAGIGPAYVGFRDPCLTTWLHPKARFILHVFMLDTRGNLKFEFRKADFLDTIGLLAPFSCVR